MEKFQEARESAIKHIKAADHILTQTYLHLKDPKLLIAALDNTYIGFDEAIGAILHYKKYQKEIPPFHESFMTKLDLLKDYVGKTGITKEHITTARTIHEIIAAHKDSAVEFSRKDAFVISTDNYTLRTITPEKLKGFIKDAKSLIAQMEIIIGRTY